MLNWEFTSESILDIKAKAIDDNDATQMEISWSKVNLLSRKIDWNKVQLNHMNLLIPENSRLDLISCSSAPATTAAVATTPAPEGKEIKSDNATYASFDECVETINPDLHAECSSASSATSATFSLSFALATIFIILP